MARPRLTRVVIVVGLLLAMAAVAFVILVPRWVKARIIATAAAHGVALTIDDLAIAPGHARLKGVKASPLIRTDKKGAPNVSMTAATVDVDIQGLTPVGVTVSGAAVDIDGAASDVLDALATRDQTANGGASSVAHVAIHDATLTWKHLVPTNLVALRAAHVSGDVARKPGRSLGDDWHFDIAELHPFAERPGAKPLAPWSLSADRDATGTRTTLTLPKGGSVGVDVAANGARTLDVATPNATVTELGVPQEVLGMHGDETSHLELHLHHQERDPTHAEGSLVAVASDVFLGASPARTAFAVDARYAGDPSTSMKLTTGTLRAGPFTGSLTGGFALLPAAGLQASLRYESGIMSCLDAVKAQAAAYGDLGKGVAALANILGLDKAVEGAVKLQGEIEVDTSTNANRFAFHTVGDCKLSYLPSL
jgi:hypothetical protein